MGLELPILILTFVLVGLLTPLAHARSGETSFGYTRKDGTEVEINRYARAGSVMQMRIERRDGKPVRYVEKDLYRGRLAYTATTDVAPNGTERTVRISRDGARVEHRTRWSFGGRSMLAERVTENGASSWSRETPLRDHEILRVSGTHFPAPTYTGLAGSSRVKMAAELQKLADRTGRTLIMAGGVEYVHIAPQKAP